MRLAHAGSKRAMSVASPFVRQMLSLHADVAPETGGLLPWRPGALYDHPAREVFAQRAIRAAWHDAREAKKKRGV